MPGPRSRHALSAKTPSSSSPRRERRGEAAGRALVATWEASGLPQAAPIGGDVTPARRFSTGNQMPL